MGQVDYIQAYHNALMHLRRATALLPVDVRERLEKERRMYGEEPAGEPYKRALSTVYESMIVSMAEKYGKDPVVVANDLLGVALGAEK